MHTHVYIHARMHTNTQVHAYAHTHTSHKKQCIELLRIEGCYSSVYWWSSWWAISQITENNNVFKAFSHHTCMHIQSRSNHFTSDMDWPQSTLNLASSQSTLRSELAGQIHIEYQLMAPLVAWSCRLSNCTCIMARLSSEATKVLIIIWGWHSTEQLDDVSRNKMIYVKVHRSWDVHVPFSTQRFITFKQLI